MDFDKLTDKQIIDHIMNGDDFFTKDALDNALNGIYGIKANRKKTLQFARQALKENKTLRYVFIDGESCEMESIVEPHIKLWLE